MYSLLLAIIYLAFISLGLPDSLLGAAWPSMFGQMGVPVSFAGIISMIIALNTISIAMTAVAIFGFSFSNSFWMLCLWAIPYGLGAGSVDAALNNYVALHYASKHMSWLHCMWGVGTIVGPYVIGYSLSGGHGWNMGYRLIGVVQVVLTIILIFSLPLWKKVKKTNSEQIENAQESKPITLKQVFKIRGAKEIMVAFFCY